MIIKLWRVQCHACGLPADWWVDGVTLPCRCGALSYGQVDRAVDEVRAYLREVRGYGSEQDQAAPL